MRYMAGFVFCAATAYTTLRYSVFKGVAWADWPSYVLNKSLALAALTLVMIEVFRRRRACGRDPHLLRAAGLFAIIHILLSLALLSPAYYESLYSQGRLTALAGTALALGAVAAAALLPGKPRGRTMHPRTTSYRLGILGFVMGGHAALQGFAGWFTPQKWPGMMPPITLIAFLMGVAALVASLWPAGATGRPTTPATDRSRGA